MRDNYPQTTSLTLQMDWRGPPPRVETTSKQLIWQPVGPRFNPAPSFTCCVTLGYLPPWVFVILMCKGIITMVPHPRKAERTEWHTEWSTCGMIRADGCWPSTEWGALPGRKHFLSPYFLLLPHSLVMAYLPICLYFRLLKDQERVWFISSIQPMTLIIESAPKRLLIANSIKSYTKHTCV